MSSLAEIEKAAAQQKQELMLCLGARLRAEGARLPEPRQFSREQVQSWVAQDEADLKRFREPS
jgi:phage-related minor tail protein